MKSKITKSSKKSKHNFPFYYKIDTGEFYTTYYKLTESTSYTIIIAKNYSTGIIKEIKLDTTELNTQYVIELLERIKHKKISESEWIDAIYLVLDYTLEIAGTVQKF